MNLYPEPDDKRRAAASYRGLDLSVASTWLGMAVAQEAGRLDEWRAAAEAWDKARPQPEEYANSRGRTEHAKVMSEWRREAQEEFDRTWGKLMGLDKTAKSR